MKTRLLVFIPLLFAASVSANDFAEIPDFNPNTATMMISAARGISPKTTGKYGDISLDQSNGQLAIVDNISSPSCVAFLQLANNTSDANQSLSADTINLNCN
ncbi:hypothetical protein [Candidatus Thiothrix anitrata]|jgi:hypothetical protein|uniref:Uncharacterized protein n=1 Tax=Candidatus Thiothrix anitrata TaxID=2823902 RepID=A0ABX7X7A7_9GAMM|nr:hypothetical protein [Candidatus Thiothrix anitrata]QTR50968.1 hypothetical protein J8380_05230 [Candidatus Thiothrix anitrata]